MLCLDFKKSNLIKLLLLQYGFIIALSWFSQLPFIRCFWVKQHKFSWASTSCICQGFNDGVTFQKKKKKKKKARADKCGALLIIYYHQTDQQTALALALNTPKVTWMFLQVLYSSGEATAGRKGLCSQQTQQDLVLPSPATLISYQPWKPTAKSSRGSEFSCFCLVK